MISLLEYLTVLSVVSTMSLGIVALFYAILFVWSRAIDLIFPLFHFHKEFLAWNYEKYKPKVFTPKIKQTPVTKFDEDEEGRR